MQGSEGITRQAATQGHLASAPVFILETDFIETNGTLLPAAWRPSMLWGMFLVTETDADAIRAVFNEEGELAAAIELRRRFPGITDNAKARMHVRTIAGWKPLSPPCSVVGLRRRDESRDESHSPPMPEAPATEPAT
jgi:hypothetical protein